MWAFLFLCFLPGACSQGGFVWLVGSEGQSCTAACSEALTPTGQPGGLTCVKQFSKIGDSAALKAVTRGLCDPVTLADSGNQDASAPMIIPGFKCYWQSGGLTEGTCAATDSSYRRICSCTCAAKTFSPSDQQVFPCTSCTKDTHSVTGASACTTTCANGECCGVAVGTGLSLDKTACGVCPVGTYGSGNGLCVAACAAGKFKATSSSPASSSAAACTDCESGKYKATTGQTECDFCSANSDSPAGSDEHDDCLADVGFTGSAAAVTACVAGTFKTSPMSSTACTGCVAGKFKTETTQTSDTCTDCDAGKFKETAAQPSDTCGNCPDNSNSPAASGVPDDCEADAGFTGSGVTVTACVAGTFKTSPMSSTACTECVKGKFKGDTTQTSDSCIACAPPTTTIGPGSTDPDADCACDKGQTGAPEDCINCAIGKFKDVVSADLCKDCESGKFMPFTTAKVCTDCPANSNSATAAESLSDCLGIIGHTGAGGSVSACIAGTFKATADSSAACINCPAHSGTGGNSAIKAENGCLADAGFTGSGSNVEVCAANTYKATTASAKACNNCPAKSNTAGATGSTVATACVAVPEETPASDSASGSGSASGAGSGSNDSGSNVWWIILVALMVLSIGVAVLIFFLLQKKDSVAPVDDRENLKEAFDFFDTDGSGELSKKEFRTVMTLNTTGEALTDAEFEDTFKKVDVDASGVISFEEYLVWINGPVGWQRALRRDREEAKTRAKLKQLLGMATETNSD